MDAEEPGTQAGSVTTGGATEPACLYGAIPEYDVLAPRAEVAPTGVTRLSRPGLVRQE